MNKKLALIALAVTVAAASLGGATMAWFSDSAFSPQAEFTAGTVLIEADGSVVLSQYFDPEEAVYLYGAEYATGDLYEIDVLKGTAHKFYDVDLAALNPSDTYSPNGLAFDRDNQRLYFSIIKGGNSRLWFYDFHEKRLVDAGSVTGVIYGAAFYEGCYWYIVNGTDRLYKVSFHADGTVDSHTLIASIGGGGMNFGDVVFDIRDEVLYGSCSTPQMFFKYDLNSGFFEIVQGADAKNLQLAFGSDGELYGHHTWDQTWFKVNPADGSTTPITVSPGLSLNDLASGYVSVWNPGDCDKVRLTVRNVGSKRVVLKIIPTASWTNNLPLGNVHIYFSDEMNPQAPYPEPGWKKAENWEIVGSGDNINEYVLYYTGEPIAAGEEVELCLNVCLDGPGTGNEYQGQRFTLGATVEAVQVSNFAPYYQWGVEYWGRPQ